MKSVLKKLFFRTRPAETVPREPRFCLGSGYSYEYDDVPNGLGGYRMVSVFLLKADDPSFRRNSTAVYLDEVHGRAYV